MTLDPSATSDLVAEMLYRELRTAYDRHLTEGADPDAVYTDLKHRIDLIRTLDQHPNQTGAT